MSRKGSNLQDYGIDVEVDPKVKFDTLVSVTVSTLMCLASKCPLPKSNVETTKLFLSTITDDGGKTPRNIKGFLSLLKDYSGPYDNYLLTENRFEKPPVEKMMREKEEKSSLESVCTLQKEVPPPVLTREVVPVESQALIKRTTTKVKKIEKEHTKRKTKTVEAHRTSITPSKSMIAGKT